MKASSSNKVMITEDNSGVGQTIEANLAEALRGSLPQAENVRFVLSARDASGAIVGGLSASTSYGWLWIKSLWVDTAHRHQGLGRDLMARAEDKARTIGCHGALLETSNPDAMRLYAKVGYTTFGRLANAPEQHPSTHRRWFMKKAL